MIRYWFTIVCVFQFAGLWAQDFFMNQFRASDGLNTDMIKCVAQDSKGYIWIGSDDGLIQYNGIQFHGFPDATSSKYIKNLLLTRDNQLLVIHDLGITKIAENHTFDVFLEGSRSKTDSTLWYPKTAYEDSYGNIWISEPQSIVKYSNGKFERIEFGPEDNSISFVRSFDFLQINEEYLLITSFAGRIFKYSYSDGSLVQIEGNKPFSQIYFIDRIHDEITLGTNGYLVQIDIDNERFFSRTIASGGIFSDAVEVSEDLIITTSEDEVNKVLSKTGNTYISRELENTFGRTNQIFKSKDGTLWLSTDIGLLLLNPLEVRTISPIKTFQEALIYNESLDKIYALSKEELWEIDPVTEDADLILHFPMGYLLSGTSIGEDLWLSNSFDLIKVKKDRSYESYDFESYGRFIFDVHKDKNGLLWIAQEASIGLKTFDPATEEIIVYDQDDGLPVEITVVNHDENGIYAASSDPNQYLFYKSFDDKKFSQIGFSIPEPYADGFTIEDLIITDSLIWIATSSGLFKQNKKGIEKVFFNSNFSTAMVRELDSDSTFIWFGNTFGLFQYNILNSDYIKFNEQTGMPINSVNEEGILITDDKIWIGTGSGIGVLDRVKGHLEKTNQPQILSALSNANPLNSGNGSITLPYNSFLELTFSSFTFPAEMIEYSYRIPELSEVWSVPGSIRRAQYSELKSGDYTFEVKARRLGNYVWSDISRLKITVEPSFFNTPSFYFIVFILVLALIFTTRFITSYVLKRRQEELEKLVELRTSELNKYKKNLEVLVDERTRELQNTLTQLTEAQNQLIQAEKMASLGILTAGVAHEINNPMNYLQGGLYSIESIFKNRDTYKSDQELYSDLSDVLQSMQVGVDRVIKIISGLSRFSRKDDTDTKTICELTDIIENCLIILEHEIKNKCEVIKDYPENGISILGDEGSLHQLFTNVILNAVHAIESEGIIRIKIRKEKNQCIVQVSDSGKGISQEHIQKIFDPFFTTKAPGIGTGLGLFLSLKIVNEHNGTINFSSDVGKGTDVFIKFPI